MHRSATLLVLALALVLGLLALPRAGRSDAQAPDDAATIAVASTLVPGFNLIGWTQPAAPVEALFAAIPTAHAVFAWDPADTRFRVARPDGPAFLNDLTTLTPGQGLWVLLGGTDSVLWRREALRDPPTLPLAAGLNLVAWGGPDGVIAADATAGIASVVWDFDATAGAFRTFRAGQPAFLNTLPALRTGSGLWVQTEAAGAWTHPSPVDARVESGGIQVDGRNRTWRLYVPASLPLDRSVALVVGLHGGLGSGAQFAESARLDAQAEAGPFLAVYPDGIANLLGIRTWNGGRCCGSAAEQGIDDVAFIAALLDHLQTRFSIDPARIFAVGHSNGAILAYRLACELAERIAAIGVVAGSLEVDCAPTRPVSLLSIHGDADESHPLEGGTGPQSIAGVVFTSVQASLDAWIAHNGCVSTPTQTVRGAVTTTHWAGCAAATVVESLVVAGASHAWPGGEPTGPLRPDPSPDLDATTALWDFLEDHRR